MTTKLPLTTANGYIIYQLDNQLRLQSVNWYGASDAYNIVMGLDLNHVSKIAALIKSIGFNSVRLSFSNQMIHQTDPVEKIGFQLTHTCWASLHLKVLIL